MSRPELYRQLQTYLEHHQPFYFDLLRQMVSINSFTTNIRGVNAVGQLTAEAFADLGFSARRVQSENPLFGDHFILTRPGQSRRSVALISHLDTVFPRSEEERNNFHWRQVGDKLYGPGTNDIKGGTVVMYMMLAALQQVAPDIYNDITWVVLLNAAEEELTQDFGRVCVETLDETTLACLIFEGGHRLGSNWTVVTSRKGRAIYRIEIEGKAAHAGSSHHEGANAIVQLADVIQRVANLTDYGRDLTFNVGTAAGGTVINRVPHFASAAVEMRTFSSEVFEEGVTQMLALNGASTVRSAVGAYDCEVRVQLLDRAAPWDNNQGSEALLRLWQTAAADLDQRVISEARGGLSDGNWLWQHFPTVDGLGPLGDNSHCSEQSADGRKEQEYALVSSFIPKALLNTVAMLRLVNGRRGD